MGKSIVEDDVNNHVVVRGAAQFAKAPVTLLTDTRLTATTRLVYLLIRSYANESDPSSLPFPSQARLAKRLEVSTRTIARSLSELVECGWMSIVHKNRAGGGWPINLYVLEPDHPRDDNGGKLTKMSGRDVTPVSPCNVTPVSHYPESVNPEPVEPEPPSTTRESPTRSDHVGGGVDSWLEDKLREEPRKNGEDCLRDPDGNGWVTEQEWRDKMRNIYKKRTPAAAPATQAPPEPLTGPGTHDALFSPLWAVWPNKTGQRAAYNAWQDLRRTGGMGRLADCMEAIQRAAAIAEEHGTSKKVWKLANFIAKGEWEDWITGVPEGTHLAPGQSVASVVDEALKEWA